MAEPVKVSREEETPEAYVARIQDLIERDRVSGARRLIAEALERFPGHPVLVPWQKALSRARVVKVGGPLDRDRTPEYRWLETHGPDSRGEWVAVLGDRMVAHSRNVDELRAMLDATPTDFPPLVVKVQDR